MRWFRPRMRTTGRPTSANGASSFHLWWGPLGSAPLSRVTATLEVLDEPTVPALYFWALQVTFHDGTTPQGGAHLGLQWFPPHPASRAVNFGGYRAGGGELGGSASPLPSATANPNTRDYPWEPGRAYRLEVGPAGPGAWRGSVTDVASGVTTVVRDLWVGGDRLTAPVVWAEVFARCDDPPVRARWTGLAATTESGGVVAPDRLRVTYQAHADGGCDNTTVRLDEAGGVVQQTATERVVPGGSTLLLRDPTRFA